MLSIRRVQMEVFESVAIESFTNRMVQAIARDYPRQFAQMGTEGARALIGRALAKGRANHVETQGGVAVLLELMVQFGEGFERSRDEGWAHQLLAHPTLPAQVKMPIIQRRLTELSRGRVIVPFSLPA